MRGAASLSWAMVLASVLAGCADRPASHASTASVAPDAGAGQGSIAGILFDDERRVVDGADITLVERGDHTTSDGAGRFVFVNVPPGPYTLHATAGGFQSADQKLIVNPGEDAVLRMEIRRLPAPVAHSETTHYTGLFQCMVYTLVQVEPCDAPYTTALELGRQNGANASQLGAPATLVPNKYHYNFTVRPDSTGIVSELTWVPSSDATSYMWLTLTCGWYRATIDGCAGPPGQNESATANPVVYAHRRGPSPLRVEWTNPTWYPWVMAKASLTGTSDQYVGASVDQRFEMYDSVFFVGPVPADWSVEAPTG